MAKHHYKGYGTQTSGGYNLAPNQYKILVCADCNKELTKIKVCGIYVPACETCTSPKYGIAYRNKIKKNNKVYEQENPLPYTKKDILVKRIKKKKNS